MNDSFNRCLLTNTCVFSPRSQAEEHERRQTSAQFDEYLSEWMDMSIGHTKGYNHRAKKLSRTRDFVDHSLQQLSRFDSSLQHLHGLRCCCCVDAVQHTMHAFRLPEQSRVQGIASAKSTHHGIRAFVAAGVQRLSLPLQHAYRGRNPRHFRVRSDVAEHLRMRLRVDGMLRAAHERAVTKNNIIAQSNLKAVCEVRCVR